MSESVLSGIGLWVLAGFAACAVYAWLYGGRK